MLIGNDIVSLSSLDNRRSAGNPRYLEKVFTPCELEMMQLQNVPFKQVWKCWSAKESVYKILLKQGIMPFFNAKRIYCIHTTASGHSVYRFENRSFRVKSAFCRNLVYSIAVDDAEDFDSIDTGIGRWHNLMSSPDIIIDFVSERLKLDQSRVVFRYVNGKIPHVSVPDSFGKIDLSFSHDHNYWMCTFISNG